MFEGDGDQILLLVIAGLLGIGTTMVGLLWRQILGRLDRIDSRIEIVVTTSNQTNDEQWKAIRQHERELGGIDAVQRMRTAGGGD